MRFWTPTVVDLQERQEREARSAGVAPWAGGGSRARGIGSRSRVSSHRLSMPGDADDSSADELTSARARLRQRQQQQQQQQLEGAGARDTGGMQVVPVTQQLMLYCRRAQSHSPPCRRHRAVLARQCLCCLQMAARRLQDTCRHFSSSCAFVRLPCQEMCWRLLRIPAQQALVSGSAHQMLLQQGSGCGGSRAPMAARLQPGSHTANGGRRLHCMTPCLQVVSRHHRACSRAGRLVGRVAPRLGSMDLGRGDRG